jgi:hypothetical protein
MERDSCLVRPVTAKAESAAAHSIAATIARTVAAPVLSNAVRAMGKVTHEIHGDSEKQYLAIGDHP